ncbi:uncharacterized protein LOC108865032 [Galendromus occidentalis]|uniref:RING-type E3 ubiquitin transferase n=1 Tax=Galendromus occidentalis TaxID=34638 RepID=A0AAJ7PAY8_9ACAR|nr:uncharacterized protein LOC108865032 [Galendromus occidentalis]
MQHQVCDGCGDNRHATGSPHCRARDAICTACQRVGHYVRRCALYRGPQRVESRQSEQALEVLQAILRAGRANVTVRILRQAASEQPGRVEERVLENQDVPEEEAAEWPVEFEEQNWEDQEQAAEGVEPVGDRRPGPERWQCLICLDEANNAVVTPCGHLMCYECCYRWYQESRRGSCPARRSDFEIEDLRPVLGTEPEDEGEEGIPPRPRGVYIPREE